MIGGGLMMGNSLYPTTCPVSLMPRASLSVDPGRPPRSMTRPSLHSVANSGKRGVSLTEGIRGANVTLGTRGVRASHGIPGTGFGWFTQSRWSSRRAPQGAPQAVQPRSTAQVVVILAVLVGVLVMILLGGH